MRLRSILSGLFLGLLLSTAGFVCWIGYTNSHRALKQLTTQEFVLINESAADKIGNFLDAPASQLLSELSLRARREMLPLNDDLALGLNLAERLRVDGNLAWISYSDAQTGRFVGVWRNTDNAIVLNRSMPGQGPAQEEIITPDGKQVKYDRPRSANYDPRERDWFKSAALSQDIVWGEPYLFIGGDFGITASCAWRPVGSEVPAGVFTVDFYLRDLEQLLTKLAAQAKGFSCVLGPTGKVYAASSNDGAADLTAVVGDWVKNNPDFKNVSLDTTSHLVPIQCHQVKYLAAFYRLATPSGLKCIVVSMAPESVMYGELNRTATRIVLVSLLGLAVAIGAAWIVAYRVSEPLRILGHDLARIGDFDLSPRATNQSFVQEINQLRASADCMRSGLRSFMRYVPGDLVRLLLASGKDATLGGEIRRLTIFFSDIEDFTAYSEQVAPEVLVRELSEYFEILSQTLGKYSGTIDKFIGDGTLSFFNAPLEVARHENMACRATLTAFEELAARRQGQGGLAALRTRVGLHCGEVLVGNIGTLERFAYTVLGDAVNVASRLENLNKFYGTRVIASRDVHDHAGDDFEWRHLDRVAVVGRKGGMDIFELMAMRGKEDDILLRRRDAYEKALQSYFSQSFAEAKNLFAQIVHDWPDDKAARLMATRCDEMISAKLSAAWDGVFIYEQK